MKCDYNREGIELFRQIDAGNNCKVSETEFIRFVVNSPELREAFAKDWWRETLDRNRSSWSKKSASLQAREEEEGEDCGSCALSE